MKFKRFLITFIATAGGAGLSPQAPGTVGTLMAVPLVLMTRGWDFRSILVFFLVLFVAGWWAALEWSKNSRDPDSQKIVIDEVLGYFVAMGAFPREPSILLIQFLLFRAFDVLKPSPIRNLDRYGKRFQIGPMQSLGVILDDLLAGFFAWSVFALAFHFTELPIWLGISN
jgi:phosphatidylglycerophosphatase A